MPDSADGSLRTATVAVLFCDLVSSTERLSRLGDDAADHFRRAFFSSLRDAVTATSGREVKNTGDGFMVVFPQSAVDAVTCAAVMHERVEALDADDPACIRVGISAGEAVEEDRDWFGTPVVEAARLCAAADAGHTLVSDVVRALVGTRGGHRFRSRGRVALKGIPEPVAASAVERERPAPVLRTPTRRRRARWLVAATAAALAVAVAVALVVATAGNDPSPETAGAVVPPAVGYTPRYAPRACPGDVAATVTGARCGTLTVPEDRANPDNGRTVRLLVTRAPARGAVTEDPVLDLGADNLASSPVREHADEIRISPRGYAPSEPVLACPEYASVVPNSWTRPNRDARTKAEGQGALRQCRARLEREGVALDAYNLEAAGQDAVDLLRALRLSRVHLVSGDVATIAALEVVRTAPGAVATLTLQVPVVPGKSSYTDPTAYLAGAFDRYIELCEADAACAAFGDLRAVYEQSYESYRTSPRTANGDDGDGHRQAVLLDGDRIAQAVAGALLDPTSRGLLAAGIAQQGRGVIGDLTAGRVIWFHQEMFDPEFPWGAYLSDRCSYDAHTVAPGHGLSSQSLPAFSGVDDGLLEWQCEAWPVPSLSEASFDDSLAFEVPTLIVQGGLAPNVSAEWPTALERMLPRATTITFGSVGAMPLCCEPPPCLGPLRQRFIADPTAQLDLSACEAKAPKIEFVTP
jgi:class 3 adenylate cyclase